MTLPIEEVVLSYVRSKVLSLVVVLGAAACSSSPPTTTTADHATTSAVPASSAGTSRPGSSAPGASNPDKAVFLEQGNAICKTLNEQSLAVTKSYGPDGPQTSADFQAVVEKNGALIDDTVTKLRALPQPPGDEAMLVAMYEKVEHLADLSRQLGAAMKAGDAAVLDELQAEGKRVQAEANAEAKAYGLTECGKGS